MRWPASSIRTSTGTAGPDPLGAGQGPPLGLFGAGQGGRIGFVPSRPRPHPGRLGSLSARAIGSSRRDPQRSHASKRLIAARNMDGGFVRRGRGRREAPELSSFGATNSDPAMSVGFVRRRGPPTAFGFVRRGAADDWLCSARRVRSDPSGSLGADWARPNEGMDDQGDPVFKELSPVIIAIWSDRVLEKSRQAWAVPGSVTGPIPDSRITPSDSARLLPVLAAFPSAIDDETSARDPG